MMFESGAEIFHPKHCINNAVENVFSQVTLKSQKPTALDFLQSLKGQSISSCRIKTIGSYKMEERSESEAHIDDINCFDIAAKNLPVAADDNEQTTLNLNQINFDILPADDDLFPTDFYLSSFHKNIATLINSSRYIFQSCNDCRELIELIKVDEQHSSLSDESRKFFAGAEFCFRELEKTVKINARNFNASFIQNALKIPYFNHCLIIKEKLVEKFLTFRLGHTFPSRENRLALRFASKSLR